MFAHMVSFLYERSCCRLVNCFDWNKPDIDIVYKQFCYCLEPDLTSLFNVGVMLNRWASSAIFTGDALAA